MNVFAIGPDRECEELEVRYESVKCLESTEDLKGKYSEGDALIYFWENESIDDLQVVLGMKDLTVILNSVNSTLAEISVFIEGIQCNLLGFAGISGFIDKDAWEISELNNNDFLKAKSLFELLNVRAVKVADRVGLASPRVICMIINEAFYTVMEGTAEKSDIDTAMKLGTNYPGGPFEWLEKIGIITVYELLEAIYEDTKDERYKICPLLKQEYLIELGVRS